MNESPRIAEDANNIFIYEYCPVCKCSHWLSGDEPLALQKWRDSGCPELFEWPDISLNPYHNAEKELI